MLPGHALLNRMLFGHLLPWHVPGQELLGTAQAQLLDMLPGHALLNRMLLGHLLPWHAPGHELLRDMLPGHALPWHAPGHLRRLTSKVRTDPVHSTRCGRQQHL